ncbi:hypothetical protein [Psychroserpens luteolus]|uniref:hypothetical protein n=1 Tax=Psychroserpens luteolus TaxID=2855840 RepID=UPI001E309D06|nr:hypothetical protein [Psychroserpens luteolus]MCD2260938.1 hypothetical protein [Psychroserpens luteolus]
MKKVIKIILVFFALILLLFLTDVLWKSPSFYKTTKQHTLETPVMDMVEYKSIINEHRRPYIYEVASKNKGKVIVVGVEHINDPSNAQFDSIRHYWDMYKPDIALVEGRMGFLFKWLQDPIKHYGESGLTSDLAKRDNVNLYTWEPARADEIELMIKKYPAEQLAMFYALRPFYGTPKEERLNNPEEVLQQLIEERTDYEHLRHSITSWKDVDSIWKQDFPGDDWRDHSSAYGWPGYFQDIWNSSNLSRDEHMIHIILEQIDQGNTVFVTMGSSHAPRIENTLKTAIK